MGIDVEESDVRKLLEDKKMVNELITAITEDPEALEDLAEDVAGELADLIEEEPEIRRKIVEAAVATPDFRKRVVKELAKEIGD